MDYNINFNDTNIQVAPTGLILLLMTFFYRQVVPDGTSVNHIRQE